MQKADSLIEGWMVEHEEASCERCASSPTFSGTRRELLRVARVVQNLTHPFGAVESNPPPRRVGPSVTLHRGGSA